jgi:hypothetical protein
MRLSAERFFIGYSMTGTRGVPLNDKSIVFRDFRCLSLTSIRTALLPCLEAEAGRKAAVAVSTGNAMCRSRLNVPQRANSQ